jgi:hypothetical protein
LEQCLARHLQPWDIPLDGSIRMLDIHSQIIVNEDISKSGESFPINLGSQRLDLIAEPLRGLRHRLKISESAILYQVRREEAIPSRRRVFFDA